MDKLKMAHDFSMKLVGNPTTPLKSMESIVDVSWKYADAMQAEADKRINKERPDVLLTKDKDGNCLHFHHEFGHKKCMDCGASLGEWQPDWSQAPEWANWWATDSIGYSDWYSYEPYHGDGLDYWSDYKNKYDNSEKSGKAPSFNYQGNWQDSLRKRPQ